MFSTPNVKAMPAAAENALSTSGLMVELVSKFLLRNGSSLVIRALLAFFGCDATIARARRLELQS